MTDGPTSAPIPVPTQAVLPPQIHAQAGMVVDRMFQSLGLVLINPQARDVAVRTLGLAIISAFNSGVQFQQQMSGASPSPPPDAA